eukprot:TRINITY_DN9557_c0_g1_i1.p1 TRINITY_DN9557_c0_g1~~TRINITY_DN9557_c0_g1_i1.p1  ORF type:complete len:618 (+),score=163.99 TRINITY_DN9557_c0_g1_i1:38-1855(+)
MFEINFKGLGDTFKNLGKSDKDKEKDNKKETEKTKMPNVGDKLDDAADKFKRWRVLQKDALQDIEIMQMDKIQLIWSQQMGCELPPHLTLETKKKSFLFVDHEYKAAKVTVTHLDYEEKKFLDRMKDKDGPFKFQATELIKICCRYQKIKAKRSSNKDVFTDPENLFCEELKEWAVTEFCMMEISENNKKLLYKRIRYFEEILCADNLFDRPQSNVTHTVQQVIVAVRGLLKYQTIPVIDNELAHHDARKAFDTIKRHLVQLISHCVDFLFHVFRNTKESKTGYSDVAYRLLALILDDDNIKRAFPDSQRELRQRVLGDTDEVDRAKKARVDFLLLGANNQLTICDDLLFCPKEKNEAFPPASENKVVVTDQQLATLFVGDRSGFDIRFRGNHFIARAFLKAHALVIELGNLYTVMEKAAACASAGGTLLVYGLANAQLNAMLETTDDLLSSVRDTLNLLSQISEVRFEELVYKNEATTSRNDWIAHFKVVHSTLAEVVHMVGVLTEDLSRMKAQANAMPLYDQFQKAQKDTDSFLSSADSFSKRMSNTLGIAYEKPKPPTVMKLPSASSLGNIVSETGGDKVPEVADFAANLNNIQVQFTASTH